MKNPFTKIDESNILRVLFFVSLAILQLISMEVQGQVLTNYRFDTSTVAFTPLSGSTPVTFYSVGTATVNTDDGATNLIPIGFTFYYMGAPYTGLYASSNGILAFTAQNSSLTNALSTGTGRPVIAPLWDDQQGSVGTGSYKVSGLPGSRVFTFEWLNWKWYYTVAAASISYQCKLYETTGRIELTYRQELTATGTTSASIGITSTGTGSGNFLSLNSAGTFPGVSSTTETTTINTKPATGQVYSFTPPTPVGSGLAFGSFTGISSSSLSFDWTHTTPDSTKAYIIEISTNAGASYSYLGSTNLATKSYSATGLTPSTSYTFRISAMTEGYVDTVSRIVSPTQSTAGCSPYTAGTYAVGPFSQFTSLRAATDSLNSFGASGNIILELQNTYTSAGEIFPITFGTSVCSSGNPIITVRPELSATNLLITGNNATTLIDFNGAKNVTIDGRPGGTGSASQLTISNTNTAGVTIRYINDADFNILRYDSIKGVNSAAAGGVLFFSTTNRTRGNDSNIVEYCNIGDGATTPATLIYSLGSTGTAAQYNSNNTIRFCNLYNYWNATTECNAFKISGGNTDWVMTGNHIYQTAPRTATAAFQQYCWNLNNNLANNHIISNNYVGGSAPFCAGTPWTVTSTLGVRFTGIYINAAATVASTISGNTFANFNWTTGTTAYTTIPGVWSGPWIVGGLINVTNNTIGSMTSAGSIVINNAITGNVLFPIGSTSTTAGTYSISGNQIGGITTTGSSASIAANITAIGITSATATATFNVSNNLIGSDQNDNILAMNPSNVSQSIIGIQNTSAARVNITGNSIRNLANNSASTSGSQVIGITCTSGIDSIAYDTIQNLFNSSPQTGTGTNAAVIGINKTSTTAGSYVTRNLVFNLFSDSASTAAINVVGINHTGATTGTNIISRNFVHSLSTLNTGTTASLTGISVTGGNSNFQNNMIRLGIDSSGNNILSGIGIYGFNETGGTNNYYHNSVYVGGSGVSSGSNTYAFYTSTASTTARAIQNNVFYNARSNGSGTAKNYVMRIANGTNLNSNNNIFYLNGVGATFGAVGATDYLLITDWQGINQDGSSAHADPDFVNATGAASLADLHVQSPTPVEGGGANISSVTDDYDGQLRTSFTPTDIGADAGNFVASDVIPPSVTYTPLSASTLTTTRILTATITDATGVPTTGTLVPRVYFKKAFAGTYTSSAGSLTSGTATNGSWSFSIDPSTVGGVAAGDTIYYFVVAQDVSASNNLGSFPAGALGANVNSISTFPSTPSKYNVLFAISGTFLVGASQVAPNYTTITNAMTDILGKILNGNITLLLQSDYSSASETFPIVLAAFNADTNTRKITIKPDLGTNDTIRGNSSTSVIKITGKNYIIDGSNTVGGSSKNLSITNTSTASLSAAIWFSSNGPSAAPSKDTLKNCIIQTGSATSTTYGIVGAGTAISSAGDSIINCGIINNTITSVYYGIYFAANSAVSPHQGLYIAKNTIGSAGANLIGFNFLTLIQVNNSTVLKNDMFGILTTANINAVSIGAGVTNLSFSKNKIRNVANNGTNLAAALTIAPGVASNNTFDNNIIDSIINNGTATFTTWGCFGFNVTSGSNMKFYFNSVNLSGNRDAVAASAPSNSSQCFYIASGITGVDMRNNILVNTQTAATNNPFSYALYVGGTGSTFTTINNNDYFVSGPQGKLANVNGTDVVTLAALRTATTQDLNSINVNPSFASNTNLVPGLGTVTGLGTAIAGITTDILDTIRAAIPSIGAFEKGGDVNGPTISYTPISNGNNTTNYTLANFATITDASGVNISAGTKPRIYYKKKSDANTFGSYPTDNNGSFNGWKYVEATNAATPFSFTIDYSLIYSFSVANLDTIQYFVVAQDSAAAPNVSANPSAGFIATNVNVISSAPTTPNQYLIVTLSPLAGPYTVGSGGDYTTITAAMGDLNLRGVSAPVTFQLTDTAYSASETFPVVAGSYAGSSTTNTVTIKPATGINVTVTGSNGATAVFKFSDASNYILDGLNTGGSGLTVKSTNTGTSAAVWLASLSTGCKNISLRNMTIYGGSNTSTTAAAIAATANASLTTGGADNDSITIQGNTILTAYYGIYANGSAAVSAGGLDNWTISNNIIGPATATGATNIGFSGIWMANALNLTISGDSIRNVSTSASAATGGVFLSTNIDGAAISNNIIRDIYSSASTSGLNAINAIYLGPSVINTSVSKNVIKTIVNTSTGGYGVKAVIINTSANANVTLSNNMISDVWCFVDVSTVYWPVGIDIEGSSGGIKVYFNSINIYGVHTGWASASGSTGAAALFVATTGNNLDIRNNILMCSYDNPNVVIDKSYAFYSTSANTVFTNINYNDYFVSGSAAVLGFLGTDQITLAALRTATAKDQNSANDTVSFASPADLHLTGSSIGDTLLTGTSIVGITTDIDGQTRFTYPYVGADEIPASPLPVIFTNFTAQGSGNDVILNWSTASEFNNKGFEIERSIDAANFVYAGFVKGTQNSGVVNNYKTIDADAFSRGNVLYYRLKQIDLNGRFIYSEIVRVMKTEVKTSSTGVFPNPFSSEVTVSIQSVAGGTATMEITDVNGRTFGTQNFDIQKGDNSVVVNSMANLTAGIYFVKLNLGGEIKVMKLVKIN